MADLEKKYYPIVAKWLAKTHHCFKIAENTGLKFSRADIIGIRDIGGDLTGEIETIVVEVKRGSEAFATASGQAYGYIVYANRVYLADKRTNGFTQEELQIASHLGIGLISIDKNNKCRRFYSYLRHIVYFQTTTFVSRRWIVCDSIHQDIIQQG